MSTTVFTNTDNDKVYTKYTLASEDATVYGELSDAIKEKTDGYMLTIKHGKTDGVVIAEPGSSKKTITIGCLADSENTNMICSACTKT